MMILHKEHGLLLKARSHKYYKRIKKGNGWRYFYTEAEYKKFRGKVEEAKEKKKAEKEKKAGVKKKTQTEKVSTKKKENAQTKKPEVKKPEVKENSVNKPEVKKDYTEVNGLKIYDNPEISNVQETFTILGGKGERKTVKGYRVKIFDKYDTFYYKKDGFFLISEAKIGAQLNTDNQINLQDAIKTVIFAVKRSYSNDPDGLNKIINQFMDKYNVPKEGLNTKEPKKAKEPKKNVSREEFKVKDIKESNGKTVVNADLLNSFKEVFKRNTEGLKFLNTVFLDKENSSMVSTDGKTLIAAKVDLSNVKKDFRVHSEDILEILNKNKNIKSLKFYSKDGVLNAEDDKGNVTEILKENTSGNFPKWQQVVGDNYAKDEKISGQEFERLKASFNDLYAKYSEYKKEVSNIKSDFVELSHKVGADEGRMKLDKIKSVLDKGYFEEFREKADAIKSRINDFLIDVDDKKYPVQVILRRDKRSFEIVDDYSKLDDINLKSTDAVFNIDYLINAMKDNPNEVNVVTGSNPVQFNGNGVTNVVMPMKLRIK